MKSMLDTATSEKKRAAEREKELQKRIEGLNVQIKESWGTRDMLQSQVLAGLHISDHTRLQSLRWVVQLFLGVK